MLLRVLSRSVVMASLLGAAWAQETAPAQPKRSEADVDIARPAKSAKNQPRAALSTSNHETFKNLSIPAGQSVTLDSALDYSAADRVAVTVRGASSSTDLSAVTLQPYWAVPDAEFFSIAEYGLGTNFPFLNVGGAIFQVYGPQFKLVISNDGKTALNISQVTLFVRSL